MSALQELFRRRDSAVELAEAAEQRARALALKDPDAAADLLRKATDSALEAEVAEIAVAEQTRLEEEEAERRAAAARAGALRQLRDVADQQHEAARTFDAAAAELQRTFDELEGLSRNAETLRTKVGLPAASDFASRATRLTRALWHGCPGVAKRLRLGFAPGRGRTALADAYPKENRDE